VTFPVLFAALPDDRSVARLLECALRHERLVVPLVSPVKQPGPHYLEAKLSEGRSVRVLADPVGPPQVAGQLLSLRVVDRGQMAELLALVERLDKAPPAKRPPVGTTLESRIPHIEDAMTTASPKPVPAGGATLRGSGPGSSPERSDAAMNVTAAMPAMPPRPAPTRAATPAAKAAAAAPAPAKPATPPPAKAATPPPAPSEAYDDDDAPTLMQAPSVKGPEVSSAARVAEYVPALALDVAPDPVSFADTLMPPSSMVERTLLLPVGRGGIHPPAPIPAAGRPPPKPEEKPAPKPAAAAIARPAPIPREEPGSRSDPRAEEEGPTELHRRPQRPAKDAPSAEPRPAEARPGQPPVVVVQAQPAQAPVAQAQGMSVREAPQEAPRPAPAPRLLGRTIAGKYTIDSSIGRGATAEVFRAQHVSLKRPVAVKILHQENAGFLQFVKRFKAEAHTLSKLEHQNIARVIDFGQEPDGLLYLVMELLVGKSLEVMLSDTSQRLSARKVIDIGVQTCNALAFAHDEGVIHRDVKPENVILVPHKDEDGKPMDLVKVCDFGLAKLRDPDPENTDITMGGAVCGSPAYMSPEQIVGEKLDPRADLYALSTMLFEALTANLPYDAIGLTQLFAKKLLEPPATVKSFLADVDPGLEACIMKGLSRDRTDRQSDARAYRQELRAVLAKLPP